MIVEVKAVLTLVADHKINQLVPVHIAGCNGICPGVVVKICSNLECACAVPKVVLILNGIRCNHVLMPVIIYIGIDQVQGVICIVSKNACRTARERAIPVTQVQLVLPAISGNDIRLSVVVHIHHQEGLRIVSRGVYITPGHKETASDLDPGTATRIDGVAAAAIQGKRVCSYKRYLEGAIGGYVALNPLNAHLVTCLEPVVV